MNIDDQLRRLPVPYFTDVQFAALVGGSNHSRYGKIKRLIANNTLLHIRRGLYCLNPEIAQIKPQPLALAQHIYAPSYISLESALSYHQLIPEQVTIITSVATKRAKDFVTPLGVFSYKRIPAAGFYTEVELIQKEMQSFFIAKPWKAITDYVFCYKKNWHDLQPLVKSLRIEPEDLPVVRYEELMNLADYYQSQRINRFLQGIKRDLHL